MGLLLVVAATVAVLFWAQRRFRRRPAAPAEYQYEAVAMSRPRFKDFRYSGSTYEESQANYQNALRQWQEQTGNTAGDDE